MELGRNVIGIHIVYVYTNIISHGISAINSISLAALQENRLLARHTKQPLKVQNIPSDKKDNKKVSGGYGKWQSQDFDSMGQDFLLFLINEKKKPKFNTKLIKYVKKYY